MAYRVVLACLLLALFDPVFAGNDDLNAIFVSTQGTASTFGVLAIWLGLLLGIASLGSGLFALAKGKGNEPLSSALIKVGVGTALLGISGFVFVASGTLGLDASVGSGDTRMTSPNGPVPILDNLRAQFGSSYAAIRTIAQMMGVFLIVSGFMRFSREGKQGSISKFPYLMIIIGALLVNITALADVFSVTIFGQQTGLVTSGTGTFDYQGDSVGTSLDDKTKSYFKFALTMFAMIGFVGIISGLMGLANEQSKSTGMNFVKIVGGSLAINMELFLKFVAKSAGGTAQGKDIFSGILKLLGGGP